MHSANCFCDPCVSQREGFILRYVPDLQPLGRLGDKKGVCAKCADRIDIAMENELELFNLFKKTMDSNGLDIEISIELLGRLEKTCMKRFAEGFATGCDCK